MKWILLCIGISALAAETPETWLETARKEGLPVAALQERLREGRAKGVPDDVLAGALEQRVRYLREAREMLSERGYPLDAVPVRNAWAVIAHVREGGMSLEDVQEILQSADGRNAGRICAVLEAGESMRLGGVAASDCRLLMKEFLERGLSRMEILRASATARELAGRGTSGEALRQALWGMGGALGRGPPSEPGRGNGGGRGGPGGRGR